MNNVIFQGYYTFTKCFFIGWVVDTNDDLQNPHWQPLSVFDNQTLNQMLYHLTPMQRTQSDLVEALNNLRNNVGTVDQPEVSRETPPQVSPDSNTPFKPYLVPKDVFMKYTKDTADPKFLELREMINRGVDVDLQPVSKYF